MRKRWAAATAAVLLLFLVGAILLARGLPGREPGAEGGREGTAPGRESGGEGVGGAASPGEPPGRGAPPDPAGLASATDSERREALDLWRRRLERATRSLAVYRTATRYPPGSRPASEHADQLHPGAPIESVQPLARQGEPPVPGSERRLVVRQDRVYVVGDESVRFSVAVVGRSGEPRPIAVERAVVVDPEAPGGAGGALPLPFTDDGRGGDETAGDLVFTATLQPSRTPFSVTRGAIRVFVSVRSEEEPGEAYFDILYTPAPPGRFTGRVRETLERGSLRLHVALEVRTAGRYVVNGRVDDADGRPFAWVEFNEVLPAGRREATLAIFGLLVRDLRPAFPLVLRDVEGFLLLEDAFPDRDLLPRLVGPVHTTAVYPVDAFSDAEWRSEERSRYLEELGRDLDEASEAVKSLGGG